MTVVHATRELAEDWSPSYWLHHCANYRVDTPDGPIGFAEKVLFSDEGEPEVLAVRVGRFHTRLLMVPFSEVSEIRPECEVIELASVALA